MLEREARRKYQLELGGAMALYAVVLFGSISIGRDMPESAGRTLLLLTPLVPVLLSVWAIARQFGRMDEFQRLRSLESLAIAAAITSGAAFTYGFLENLGFPRLSMFWVWPVMGLVWGLAAAGRCLIPK
jgi:hypothetical protein